MTIEEALAFVRANWDAADGCGSCGWKSALHEHEPIEVHAGDLARGYVRFPCFSEDASENGGHRGIRVYFLLAEDRLMNETEILLPPTEAEMAQWADGIVYHTTADGTLLHYDRERRQWLASNSTPSGNETSDGSPTR